MLENGDMQRQKLPPSPQGLFRSDFALSLSLQTTEGPTCQIEGPSLAFAETCWNLLAKGPEKISVDIFLADGTRKKERGTRKKVSEA